MNRIEEKMNFLKIHEEKAFITYITAGLPDMEGTKNMIKLQFQAGADVIGLSIPFSDPVADGAVEQSASYKAIQKGVNLVKCFKMVEELREECQAPIVFRMYYNTIAHYGVESFAKECQRVGVDGLIIPDLPFEEQNQLKDALKNAGDETVLIQSVTPESKGRIPMLLENARGFVYCASSKEVNIQDTQLYKGIREYLESVKKISEIPVIMGFGINTPEAVKPFSDITDGAAAGSYFIKLMEEWGYDEKKAEEYVRGFKADI